MTASAGARSLSQRIRADLEHQIVTGALKPGERIPVEHALAAQYGCSRMTVTRATEALAAAGLITRRRRAGSFVAQPHAESAVLEIPDIPAEVTRRGWAYGLDLLGRLRLAAGEAEGWPGCGDDLLQLDCLHRADGRPFALEHRLIDLAAVPEADAVDFATEAPGTWLLGHVPWTRAEHRIRAVAAGADTARALALAPGASCLVLERQTWRGETAITWVRQTFPGDGYDLVARFATADRR